MVTDKLCNAFFGADMLGRDQSIAACVKVQLEALGPFIVAAEVELLSHKFASPGFFNASIHGLSF